MKKFLKENYLILIILFVISVFICLQSSFSIAGSYAANSDAAIYKQIAYGITKGEIPYKDMYDNKGPVFYYLLALGELVNNTWGIFVIEVFLMFVSCIFCYRSLNLFYSKNISLISTILTFVSINNIFWNGVLTEEFVLPFTFISLFLFCKYLKFYKVNPLEIGIIGFFFAASILIRANLIAVFVGFALIIFINLLYKKKFKDLIIAVGSFLGGCFILIIPILLYFYFNDALLDFLQQVYFGPSSYFSDKTVIEKMQILHNLLLNLSNYGYIFIILYFGYVMNCVFKKKELKFSLVHVGVLVSIIFNMYLSTMSNANFSHYSLSFIPLIAFPIGVMIDKVSNFFNENRFIFLFVILLLGYNSFLNVSDNIFKNLIGKYDNIFYKSVDNLTSINDRIYIFDGYNFMYHTKRLSASKYLYLPIDFDVNDSEKVKVLDELYNELNKELPKLILISDSSLEKYLNLKYYDFNKFIKFLNQNYDEVNNFYGFHYYELSGDI